MAAGVGAGTVIAGAAGAVVFSTALGLLYWLRHRPRWYRHTTLGLSAGGIIAAGAVLSRHPWLSVDGYAGHWPSVQLLALLSLWVLTAAAVIRSLRRTRR